MEFGVFELSFELSTAAFALISAVSFVGAAITAAFGVGGGLLLIGTMSALLPPAAVIPVHAVIMVSSNASRSALLIKDVAWPIIGWFVLGALVGGLIGAQIVVGLPPMVLRLAVAGFILFTQWGPTIRFPTGALFYALAGSLSMVLTLFVGASGPFMTAILSRLPSFTRQAVIATAGAAMVVQHAGKAVIFGLADFPYEDWVGLIVAGVVFGFLGAFVGTRLLKRMDEAFFKKALRLTLTLLAVWLVALAFTSKE